MIKANTTLKLFSLIVLGTVAVGTVSGCSQKAADNSTAKQQEIAQLQMELDQLANAVGRLEFRLYELETHHSDTADMPARTEPSISAQDNNEPDSGKRYDLTPVE
jgi:hypothetical protein